MSISIDTDKVEAVLLGGIWHEVTWQNQHSTFRVDEYDYVEGTSGLPPEFKAFGFEFLAHGLTYAGPVEAIQAVRSRRD